MGSMTTNTSRYRKKNILGTFVMDLANVLTMAWWARLFYSLY